MQSTNHSQAVITETSGKPELLNEIENTINRLLQLISGLNPDQVNTVPYKDSWTPGQLLRHVTKSLNGMTKGMKSQAKPVERDSGERIPELKKVFLDFSTKLKSPDFIVPEQGPYEKNTAINEFWNSFEQFKASADNASLDELVEGLPLGPITRLEIIHFTLYHMQRHLHQMGKICDALKNKAASHEP